jgi:hypothetical protein
VKNITDRAAAEEASHIKFRLNQLLMGALASDIRWHYSEIIVPDSSHVWNGKMHKYNSAHTFGAWMAYRSISIILIRTLEPLYRTLQVSADERELQTRNFEAMRRQMVDEICVAVPCVISNPDPADKSCMVVRAYSAIWPLYLAGICALERARNQALRDMQGDLSSMEGISYASAQAAWILGRLQYIATHVGLKWASVIATFLKDNSHSPIHRTLE